MKLETLKEPWLRSTMLAGFAAMALVAAAPASAMAQDADDEDAEEDAEEVEGDEGVESIVVTGSRLRRDAFSTTRPIQVLSGEVARDIGLFDAGSIVQESTASTGLQIDTTFNGFVLDNGPGAVTANLRGLGAARSLVLVNGRRLAPSGVEGAPGVPNLNVIPASLIERAEQLLDGASSIYGSDAVAGVVNAVLRKDFDGLELDASVIVPEQSEGSNFRYSATWGVTGDRGFIGFGAEYQVQDNITLADRDVFGPCRTNVEITETGELRAFTDNTGFQRITPQGSSVTNCISTLENRILDFEAVPGEFDLFAGSFGLFPTPGTTNIGVPNFSAEEINGFGLFFNQFNAGILDSPFQPLGAEDPLATQPDVDVVAPFFSDIGNPQDRQLDVIPKQQNINVYTYGEYDIGTSANITSFFEFGFSNSLTEQQGNGTINFNVAIPANNPFNPCNPNATGVEGVDCGAAFDDIITQIFGGSLTSFGFPDPAVGARSVETDLNLNVTGADNLLISEVTQFRFVGGLRGDLPTFGTLSDWRWEAFASYDRSIGISQRTQLDDNSLALSLLTTIEDPNNPGNFICGLDGDGDGIPDPGAEIIPGFNTTPDCVAVNPIAPSLFQQGGGDLATQEEFDFLVGVRTFDTIIEQTVFQAFADGKVFSLPAGDVLAGVGVEWRLDTIDSRPDDAAANGENVGFFADLGATGQRNLIEGFYEVEIPILADVFAARELTINNSGRFTRESQSGTAFTYSGSGSWRPHNSLLVRGGYGTSFRAPNLRESFVLGQSGFTTAFDPCVVPQEALVPPPDGEFGAPVFDPALDTRDPVTLQNCMLAGVDPTALMDVDGIVGIEVFDFGGIDIEPETSRSFFGGFVWEQGFFDNFDFRLAGTYWDILVENTLIEAGPAFVIDQCFNEFANLASPLCPLITRDALGFISEVQTPFINQDAEIARGVDINAFASTDFVVQDREFTVGTDITLTRTIERTTIISTPGSEPLEDPDLGEQFNPRWQGNLRAFAQYGDFRLTWFTQWTSGATSVTPDPLIEGDTCGAPLDDLLCRDTDTIDDAFIHDMSLRYNGDSYTLLVGVNNVLDTEPQLIDGSEFFEVNGTNVAFGRGQDFQGRRFFVNVRKTF